MSVEAEEKCNMSVSGPLSPVEQSKETRANTKEELDSRKDRFLRAMAAHNKSLDELQQKAHGLGKTVHHLSNKVGRVRWYIKMYRFGSVVINRYTFSQQHH